jgi:Fe-S cluster assembly iron-binding protein IscA
MKRHFAVVALAATIFAGCSSENKGEATDYAATDTIAAEAVANGELVEKMTKTADMRFRVKDVQRTKEDLSATIRKQGGLVMEFDIKSSIQNSEKVKFSSDSLKEITSYRTDGYVVARIPSDKLDDLTNQIAGMAVFVDNQSLKMEDKSLDYLENKLKTDNRIEAVEKISKVATKKSANVETSLIIKDDYVDKKIENLNIDKRVKYSTISLSFYQDNTIKTMIVANDNIYDYKPDFFRRLGLNLMDGWMYFKEFILFLSQLWLFFLAGLVAFFVIRYYTRKQSGKTFLPPPTNNS